jgi:NAD(P)-dependent dehydrogenase (short-subunit alcohol dehydrogenase family)
MDRAALLTGGSSGIGLAVAAALRRDGYAVTLTARREDRLRAAARELSPDGDGVLAVPGDMADELEIKGVVAAHRERFGRLDVLINNAGVGIQVDMAETETSQLDLLLAVNLRGVYLVARECIPMLKEAAAETGKALIANTASYAGVDGQARLSAYSATKFGVVGLSQSMHKELSDDGIHVTALCPGYVATPMTDPLEDRIPKQDMIRPEDLAEAVTFLVRTSPHCFVPEIQFLGSAPPLRKRRRSS